MNLIRASGPRQCRTQLSQPNKNFPTFFHCSWASARADKGPLAGGSAGNLTPEGMAGRAGDEGPKSLGLSVSSSKWSRSERSAAQERELGEIAWRRALAGGGAARHDDDDDYRSTHRGWAER